MKNFLTVVFLLLTTSAGAQYTYMVKDLSNQNEPSNSKRFFQSGGLDYFIADDGIHGNELWRTDGTSSGTFMLKDIYPGTESGMYNWPNDPLFLAANGNLYFTARSSGNNQELWFSDGTISGTHFIKDYESMEGLVYNNGYIYYFFNDSLYKSDGTINGTSLIYSFPSTAGVRPPRALTLISGYFYFIGYDALNGYEPWISDGTTGGILLLKDINPGTASALTDVTGANSILPVFYESGGKVIFIANDSTDGHELWITDGTTNGTQLIKDIYPGISSGIANNPVMLTNANGKFYFYANDGINGVELWTSDGTASGTFMLHDFNPIYNTIISEMIKINSTVYFVAPDTAGTAEVWKTDGTALGTSIVKDLSDTQPASYPYGLTSVNNQLYFILSSFNEHGAVIYTSDGTAAGTYSLITGAGFSNPDPFCIFNYDLYFSFIDTLNNEALWKINTSSNTLQIVKDIKQGSLDDHIGNIHELNGKIIFTAQEAITNNEPWSSDGTNAGTSLLKDINTNGNSYIEQLQDLNGLLMYSANDAMHGSELWKSNGNTNGTKMVMDADPLFSYGSVPYYLETFRNKVYYRCYPGSGPNSNYYNNLWSSNGQAAGTGPVDTLVMRPDFLKAIDNNLYISSANGFYKSDGTAAGTQLLLMNYIIDAAKAGSFIYANTSYALYAVDSLNNSTAISFGNYIDHLAAINDTFYFSLAKQQLDTFWIDTVNFMLMYNMHNQLWQSNGLISNTTMLIDSLGISGMVSSGNDLYVLGQYKYYTGLYKYNGNSGLTLVKSLNMQNFPEMIVYNGKILFQGTDSTGDSELWISDGTSTGTIPVKNINISGNSDPDQLIAFNNKLYFTADDGINGRELWMSDGTAAGTSMVIDINPTGSSNPSELTVSGDNLYFVANDGVHGRELWAHALYTTSSCFAYFETSYDTASNTFTLAIDPVTVSAAVSYHWDFGDGAVSAQANPSHTYAANDIYKVCLTAYTASGDSCKFCHNLGIDIDGNLLLKASGFNIVAVNGVSNIVIPNSNEDRIFVSPNPSNGHVTLSFNSEETANVKVLNMAGKIVKNLTGFQSGKMLDISDQPSGIFIVEIYTGMSIQRIKLNKQ